MRKVGFAVFACLISAGAFAWDGQDATTNAIIEIDAGNLVREGETIDFYDHDAGEYRTGDVQSINQFGSSVEVEVYDNDSGEYRTFEMDD